MRSMQIIFSQQLTQVFSCRCFILGYFLLIVLSYAFKLRFPFTLGHGFFFLRFIRIRHRDSIVSDVWRLGHTELHVSWSFCALGTNCIGFGAFSSHFDHIIPLCYEPHEARRQGERMCLCMPRGEVDSSIRVFLPGKILLRHIYQPPRGAQYFH